MGRRRTCDCGACRKCQKRAAQWRYVRGIKVGRKPIADRFWEKVEKTETCWLWTGYLDAWGYGRFRRAGESPMAHRAAYELLVGTIPPGMQVDHRCGVTRCVNPAHMDIVTGRVNILRSNSPPAIYARSSTCVHGHEFTASNTRIEASGQRRCRECERLRAQRRREKAKAKG